jgi:hypothetical protein
MKLRLIFAFLVMIVATSAIADTELLWQEQVYADGRHNAFTDLAYWKGHYYVCFRHGDNHNSMDGEIRVMRSADMKTWEPCGTLRTVGDDRDPHFAQTEDRLYVYFGVWDMLHPEGHGLPGRNAVKSYFSYSEDGESWSDIKGVYESGYWLWRVRYHDGTFYSAAYTAVRPRPDSRETHLVRSEDGLNWELVSVANTQRMAGEADMRFNDDGSMWLLTRTGDEAGDAMILTSDATKTEWTSEDTGTLVHSPAIVEWEGRLFVAGRGRDDDGYNTSLWELKGTELTHLLTLPSGGDTSYPGLLVCPDSIDGGEPELFITWYSQHESEGSAAAIYAGRIAVRP